MKRARSRPRVAILGCGAVGRALAIELLDPDRPAPLRGKLCVWSRSRRSLGVLRKVLPGPDGALRVLQTAREALTAADIILLCVADEAIVPFVRDLARDCPAGNHPVVVFTNGYLPLSCLAPLRRRGIATGRLHPLAPIPTGLEHANLINAHFGIEGDTRAVRAARQLVMGIRGEPLLLTRRRGAAQAYHAGASLLSGGLVALFTLAERVMSRSVGSRAILREALADFAEITIENTWYMGPDKALTGALARGSESIVRGHLRALRSVPEALELYRLLGGTMLEIAHARRSIDRAVKRRLLAVLSSPRGVRGLHYRERARRWRRLGSARG